MFISLGVQAQDVTGVTLNHDTITLYSGEDTTLIATFAPANPANKNVNWSSDSEVIAGIIQSSLTEDGKQSCQILAGNPGEAKIRIRTIDGNFRDSCVIIVIRPMAGLDLSEHEMEMTLGRDSVLKAIIMPLDATNDSIIWVSRDSLIVNILSTDANRYDTLCHLSPIARGTTFIVAQTVDGGFKDSCEITVGSVLIESFTFDNDSIDLIFGSNSDTTLIARIRPLDGTEKKVYWSTDDLDENVIQISSGYDTTSVITVKGVGRAMVFAESFNRVEKDSCVITVYGSVESISLNKDSLTLNINADTLALKASITPSFVVDDSVIWTSNDPNTVFISSPMKMSSDSSCRIEALRAGTAIIYAETVDGGFKDSCVVTVVVPTDSIVLLIEKNPLNLKNDTTTKIVARFYPNSGTNKSLTWHNTNNALINIDSIAFDSDTICYIKALNSGIDTIYAVTPEGIISDSCFIVINNREVDSVIIRKSATIVNDKDTVRLYVGETFDVVTTVYPTNATNRLVNLVSSDPLVARVDSILSPVFVKALNAGVSKVYATPADGLGGKRDSIIIKVENKLVTSLSLSADTIRILKLNSGKLIATILPVNATNDSVNWSTNNETVVGLVPSAGTDTLTFTTLKADTAIIYAVSKENITVKDSCVVIVEDRMIYITADTVTVDGKIELSIEIPDGVGFNGAYFELQFPAGFGLTKEGNGYRTALTDAAKLFANLIITKLDDNTYHFLLDPKVAATSMSMTRATTMVKIMDVYYTIFDNTLTDLNKIYEVKFKEMTVSLTDDTFVKEDHVVKVKAFNDLTSNDIFENTDKLPAYFVDGLLFVNSNKAETVYVFSINGSLLYMKDKTEGQAVFNIKTDEKILIVKGSSGWAGKVGTR